MKKVSIVPKHGERALIIGQTGSGKTAFARFLLSRMPGAIIYDTKHEPKFNKLTKIVVKTVAEAMKAFREQETLEYVIVRPPVGVSFEPKLLDEMLMEHYEIGRNITAYIDEVYQFHVSGKAGPGLLALLTRGRSRGITTVMSTQRPAWLSRFCLTEAQRFYIFNLVDKRDWKTIGEIVPGSDGLPKLPRYHFFYYDYDLDRPVMYAPVPFDDGEGYTDVPQTTKRWF